MDKLYGILVHAHSGLRWLVLIALLWAIGNAFMKWRGEKAFLPSDRKLNASALGITHLQVILGLILYFISPKVIFESGSMKDGMLRFFLVEHITMMLIAVVLITIGNSRAKKATEDVKKHKTTFIFFLIGLLIMLASIPWPFIEKYKAGWF